MSLWSATKARRVLAALLYVCLKISRAEYILNKLLPHAAQHCVQVTPLVRP